MRKPCFSDFNLTSVGNPSQLAYCTEIIAEGCGLYPQLTGGNFLSHYKNHQLLGISCRTVYKCTYSIHTSLQIGSWHPSLQMKKPKALES